jgi:gas vesicle protein
MADHKKARKQADMGLGLGKLRDIHLDDIDLKFLQKREDEAASRGFLGGFLLGALIGAVIALIFAPQKGQETRGLVLGAAGDLKEKATDLVQQTKSESESADSQGTDDFSDGPAIEREIGDAAEPFGESVASPTDDSGTRPVL